MEKNIGEKLLRWILGIFGVILAMYICASASYNFVRKKAPSQTARQGAADINDKNTAQKEEKFFPNLPVTISGTYSEETDFAADTNDYLVIAEGTLVNLYTINKEGVQIFEKVLEIDFRSLKPEDRALLTEGILLDNKSDLLSLIEDYSS